MVFGRRPLRSQGGDIYKWVKAMQEAGRITTAAINILGINLVYNPHTVIMTWVVILVIIFAVILFKRRLGIYPHRSQCLLEGLIIWFNKILKESLGKDARKFIPFIVSLFLFILISNWFNVIPGLSSPTKDLNTCLGLGILVFFISHIYAIRKKGIGKYLKSYFEPFWFLFPSNVFSEVSKVLSHSFRLYGNIFAGGVVISLLPFLFSKIKWLGVFVGTPVNLLFSLFFGIFLAAIQAFVFTMLAIAYISVLSQQA